MYRFSQILSFFSSQGHSKAKINGNFGDHIERFLCNLDMSEQERANIGGLVVLTKFNQGVEEELGLMEKVIAKNGLLI